MKTLKTIAKCITVVMLCTATNLIYSQPVTDLEVAGGNRWGRLNPAGGINAFALGIGNFAAPFLQPASALHVNTNLITNPFYGAGEVFCTQAPTANTQAWRMLTGTGAGIEKFAVLNAPLFPLDIILQSTSGNMYFNWFNQAGASMQINRNFGGVVGIGDYTAFQPRSWLHLHDGVAATYLQVTNNFSGSALATDGARFGTAPVTVGTVPAFANIPFAEVRQEENAPLRFMTNGVERMRIMGNINQNIGGNPAIPATNMNPGFVGIGCTNPMALLHVGNNSTFFANGNPADGYRNWMINGTLYQFGSDNLYTGFNNQTGEATISWGNDPTVLAGPDRLIFRFTAAQNIPIPPFAAGLLGIEAARYVTNGNRFFIGFGGDPNNPAQNPYTANPDPGNTVEINSVANALGPLNSGLRFTDVNNTVAPINPNPSNGVLSLNNLGDVIWVQDGGGGGGIVGYCTPGPIPTLTGHAGTNLGGSNFYFEDGPTIGFNSVGIGLSCGTPTKAKLDVYSITQPTAGNFFVSGVGVTGVRSTVNPTGGVSAIAGDFRVSALLAQQNIGIRATIGTSGTPPSGDLRWCFFRWRCI